MKRAALKASVSLALLAWVLHRIDVVQALSHFRDLSPWWTAGALALGTGGLLLGAWKWSLLPGLSGPYGRMLRLFWIGAFFNNLLPGRTGGDLYRAYGVSRLSPDRIGAALTVAVDRGLNLVALVAMALAALLLHPTGLVAAVRTGLVLGLLGLSAAGIVAYRLIPFIAGRLSVGTRTRRWLEGVGSTLADLKRRPRAVILAFGLALLYQATVVLANYAVARALGLPVQPAPFFYLIPVTAVITMLPVALNGIGLREGAYAVVFSAAGLPPDAAVAISVGATLCMVALSLVGGVLYVTGRGQAGPGCPDLAGEAATRPRTVPNAAIPASRV